MSIPIPELKRLLLKSGNRCAFQGCGKELFRVDADPGSLVQRNEIAHIVSDKPDGPRGSYPLPVEQRNLEPNLILLCEEHHHQVDEPKNIPYFSVERLRQYKEDHERRIREATGRIIQHEDPSLGPVKDTVYSSLLPVTSFPAYVFSAPCTLPDPIPAELHARISHRRGLFDTFVVRESKIFSFVDLRRSDGPFANVVDFKASERYSTAAWEENPVHLSWLIELLNRSLHHSIGSKGLRWDHAHQRYFFVPDVAGQLKEITYTPLNKKKREPRQVVWQPITRETGLPKPFWYHRAINLRFLKCAPKLWCLALRPEYQVTRDGEQPYASEKIGSKITKKKARAFNFDYLSDIQFWRSFLSDDKPRIVMDYGSQALVVSSEMMTLEINWPGIPAEYRKSFKNVEFHEDLFSWQEAQLAGSDTVDWDDDEESDAYDDSEEDDPDAED